MSADQAEVTLSSSGLYLNYLNWLVSLPRAFNLFSGGLSEASPCFPWGSNCAGLGGGPTQPGRQAVVLYMQHCMVLSAAGVSWGRCVPLPTPGPGFSPGWPSNSPGERSLCWSAAWISRPHSGRTREVQQKGNVMLSSCHREVRLHVWPRPWKVTQPLMSSRRTVRLGWPRFGIPYANTWAMRARDTVSLFLQNFVAVESSTRVNLRLWKLLNSESFQTGRQDKYIHLAAWPEDQWTRYPGVSTAAAERRATEERDFYYQPMTGFKNVY